MIEDIFFETSLRDEFVAHAVQRGVPCAASDDTMGMVVAIPEDLSEELSDEMERFYEHLEHEQENLSLAEGDLYRLAGFGFTLPNGQARLLFLNRNIANRLCVSLQDNFALSLLPRVSPTHL